MIIKNFKKLFQILFSTSDYRVHCYVVFLAWLKSNNYRLIGLIVSRRLQRKYGVFLPYSAEFDSSLVIRHPTSVIIGEGVVLGKNVTIFQNVTLGRADTHIPSYPKIGNNAIIYAGAVVLGGVTIGDDCIVGANSVVVRDVPDGATVAGIPAKIIRYKA